MIPTRLSWPRLTSLALSVVAAVTLLAIWEWSSRSGFVNPLLFPPPTSVAIALHEWFASGDLWLDALTSSWRALIGLLVAAIFGVSIGILTGRNRIANAVLSPIIQAIRPLPPVAIIPLVIIWMGIGDTAKLFSITFACFFPIWLNTHLGAAAMPIEYQHASRVLKLPYLHRIFSVVIPSTAPSIISGIRIAISVAFIMVYVSEIAGASHGIGYRISIAHLAYRIDLMMAALAVLAMLGATFDTLFRAIISLMFPWINNAQS